MAAPGLPPSPDLASLVFLKNLSPPPVPIFPKLPPLPPIALEFPYSQSGTPLPPPLNTSLSCGKNNR